MAERRALDSAGILNVYRYTNAIRSFAGGSF
jgi:hypothetical protein